MPQPFDTIKEAYEAGWTTQHIVWKGVARDICDEIIQSDDQARAEAFLFEMADLADDAERCFLSVTEVEGLDRLIVEIGDQFFELRS